MRVLVALSGGVDSSVAAARLIEQGHEVTGLTMRLWGGPSDSGCCSVADVDDARRVAHQLGIAHHVFDFEREFEERVVAPYVADHAAGRTPNPCVECNRHLKFSVLLERAERLGFDRVATGHHARLTERGGEHFVTRGVDAAKDQSYVLHPLDQAAMARCLFPVGDLTKDQVRAEAARLGLRTADKPDSQDVCFVTASAGRAAFLASRRRLTPGRVVDRQGRQLGRVEAVELITVGQRRGLGLGGGGARRFALEVRPAEGLVVAGDENELLTDRVELAAFSWVASSRPERLWAQTSAHGEPRPGRLVAERFVWDEPQRRVAPGQSVVFYDEDRVVASAHAA